MEWERENMGVRNTQHFNNKRRKKSLINKARAQGKRGRYGRGNHIDCDTYNYLLHVFEVNLGDFTNPEDKEIFIDNIFEQIAGREVEISCNQLGSRTIEKFLPCANDKILLRFTYAFSKDLRKISCDEFGSHVLQELIVVVSAQLQKTTSDSSTEEDNKDSQFSPSDMTLRFKNWLHQVCRFVVNSLDELMWDNYANYIVRTVLECLSGLPAGSTLKEAKCNKGIQLSTEIKNSPLEEGHSLVQECGNHILQMPQIVDAVYSPLTSSFLQTLLATVHKVDIKLSRKIVRHLLDQCYNPGSQNSLEDEDQKKDFENNISEIFTNKAATHLMDVMISSASKKTFTQIYARCFINKLKPMSLAPDANFCVQTLIKHCTEKVEFEAIFDELSSNFGALLHSRKHGVLLALCQTCQKLGCKQGQFIKTLQAALLCVDSERQGLFPMLVAHLVDYETWKETESAGENSYQWPVSLQGSLLLQSILHFPETIKIVKGMLAMHCKHLEFLLCDASGSHIADAFFTSKSVGEKSKQQFCRKLQGCYVALAVSKYGSRVLDIVWERASLNIKKMVLEELAPSEAMLNGVRYGSLFCTRSGLSLFKRNSKKWEEIHMREESTKKRFADIVGT